MRHTFFHCTECDGLRRIPLSDIILCENLHTVRSAWMQALQVYRRLHGWKCDLMQFSSLFWNGKSYIWQLTIRYTLAVYCNAFLLSDLSVFFLFHLELSSFMFSAIFSINGHRTILTIVPPISDDVVLDEAFLCWWRLPRETYGPHCGFGGPKTGRGRWRLCKYIMKDTSI